MLYAEDILIDLKDEEDPDPDPDPKPGDPSIED